jgi:ABC-2 type transport system ATP-binding protein
MIIIRDLVVRYRGKENVIDSLNLTLPGNTIHGIVGLNGAGKTTLFNAIFGLKNSLQGDILYNNQLLTKKEIAYLPAEDFFYSNITGREYLDLFYNPETFDIEQWNKLFTLPLDQVIDEYSTGMKKKLDLLGVIKQNKPVLMLDEPFNGLDIEMSRIIRLVLLRLKEKGKTIIISSHIMETLSNLCDYIHYLENGKIKYSAPKEEFDIFEKEIFNMIEKDSAQLINELIQSGKS